MKFVMYNTETSEQHVFRCREAVVLKGESVLLRGVEDKGYPDNYVLKFNPKITNIFFM